MNKVFSLLFLGLTLVLSAQEEASEEINYYEVGGEFAAKGEFKKAIEFFDKEIEIRPKNYYAWFNKALAVSYLGLKKEALEYFTQTIILKPDYGRAYMNRALISKDLKRYTQALMDLDMAVKVDPDYGLSYYHRSIINEYLENHTQACFDIKTAKNLGIEKLDDAIEIICEKGRSNNYANIGKIFEFSKDVSYGFKASNPIKVGEGIYGSEYNQIAFIGLLRDHSGNLVKYKKKGTCCKYPSENSLTGMAHLTMYKVFFKDKNGKSKSSVLYLTSFDFQSPKIPLGFKTLEE